jgi:hypothetical protein
MNRKLPLLLLVFLLGVLTFTIASGETVPVERQAAAQAEVNAKIHANLLADMKAASASTQLQFVARITEGTDLSAFAERWFARPFIDPLGTTVASGYATATGLQKMAAQPGVIKLQRAESLAEVPVFEDPDIESLTRANIEPQINTDPDASPGPAPEGWYGTGSAIHGSQEAWDKGYTGAGVRYMSNDSGADYCHPDLHGTWAYIEESSSAYYGLPEMFDSISSYQAALDYYLGTSFIADGIADYADTSATTAGPNFTYAPIGATTVHTYTVPATSLSGTYHYGSHPDKALAANAGVLSGAFGDGTAVAGERAAVLVVDENTSGVYDTVYVDLDYNYDFTNDTPARLSRDFNDHETACLDYDVDGLNDVSGGLVYFISDGATAVPTLDWLWGIPGTAFGNGDLVAFHVQDFTEGGGDHGMGTTSVAVGQGVVIGSVNVGADGYDVADFQGLVVGPGKDVASTQNGDFYQTPFIEDAYLYATLGYDAILGTGDDIQIVSNSWGFSGTDNDGFDFESRLIDSIIRGLNPTVTALFSTGNGAAGYGTTSPPSPSSGISVGASTLYGSIGLFESIASSEQIVGGDPMSWSNRGPGARGVTGVDVVATGAFGTGDLSLNQVLWGAIATSNFGGTSMSAPVAAGNLALIYQAYYENHNRWPTFDEAQMILMGTAKNTKHDVWTQGGGLVDADEGTEVAGGHSGIVVSPSEWAVGDYRDEKYEAFASIIAPSESDSQSFTIHNAGDVAVRVRLDAMTLKMINTRDYSFTSLDQSLSHGSFTTPDYAFRIDQDILNATDLLQVRLTKPYDQFDPNEDYSEPFSNWRVHLQNWTDLNGDGKFWEDLNDNGKVDIGEMDTDEHIRYTYGYDTGPGQQARISDPLERMNDGILLTLRHRNTTPDVPTTDLTIEASYWQWTKWSWIHSNWKNVPVPAGGSADFTARIKVPPNTPFGMYQGAIVATVGNSEVVIPVSVSVAAEGTSFEFGQTNYANGRTPLYDNENVFGYTDYSWRAESGDWRFYWTDVDGEALPDSGTNFLLVDNAWVYSGTDIDTIIQGPTPDDFTPSSIYGPYTLEQTGRSANTYIGSGRWLFQTSSGGPREIISAPIPDSGGLHSIQLHQVRVDGNALNDPFQGQVGLANLDPAVAGGEGSGSADVTISSEIALSGFVAEGFGLGGPVESTETVMQDDPNDPSTASFTTTVTIDHGALLEVNTCCTANGSDIDLYVYDPSGNLVAQSTTSTDVEHVSILFPEDGEYKIAVHGWSVPSGTDTFELTINAVQGYDVSVSNLPAAIPAGGSATVTVSWDASALGPGTYGGVVLMGPSDAPALFQIPVMVSVP